MKVWPFRVADPEYAIVLKLKVTLTDIVRTFPPERLKFPLMVITFVPLLIVQTRVPEIV